MDYRLRLVSLKCAIKVILLKDITLNERTSLQRVAMAPRQIIKRDRLKSVSRQFFAGVGADEPGTACHQDRLHLAARAAVTKSRSARN
jgi:hypothetical protein